MSKPQQVVAIPVHNEAGHIGSCLRSFRGQDACLILLVNNTTDATVACAMAEAAASNLEIVVDERMIAQDVASAGRARVLAMQSALRHVEPGGALMTTDADTRVAPDWIEANLRHIRAGCDAVAGRALIDPVDAAKLPARLHEDDAREGALMRLLDEIASLVDPDVADPWPRHAEHSGASICITADAYIRAGGMPDVALGEDRALFAALRRVDAVIRHAPEVEVTVSGRLEGRARGGMADTMRRRLSAPDLFLDDTIEPVHDAVRRFRLRARARQTWQGMHESSRQTRCTREVETLASELGLQTAEFRRTMGAGYFGEAWAELEARCRSLVRRRVPVADVGVQNEHAQALLATLRVSPMRQTNPGDTFRPAGARSA